MLEILCSVCTDTLFADDHVAATSCCHVFHEKCLIDWVARSKSCPECRAVCTQEETRRLFFNSEPVLEPVNEITINKLNEELASQKQKFEEQLCVETEIRREMHQTIKKLQQQVKDLTAAKNTSSSDSAQAADTVSTGTKISVEAAIPTEISPVSISVVKSKPSAIVTAASSIATAYKDLNDNTLSTVKPSTSGSTHSVSVTDNNSKASKKHKMFPVPTEVKEKKFQKIYYRKKY